MAVELLVVVASRVASNLRQKRIGAATTVARASTSSRASVYLSEELVLKLRRICSRCKCRCRCRCRCRC